jgi:hypothetical protein
VPSANAKKRGADAGGAALDVGALAALALARGDAERDDFALEAMGARD